MSQAGREEHQLARGRAEEAQEAERNQKGNFRRPVSPEADSLVNALPGLELLVALADAGVQGIDGHPPPSPHTGPTPKPAHADPIGVGAIVIFGHDPWQFVNASMVSDILCTWLYLYILGTIMKLCKRLLCLQAEVFTEQSTLILEPLMANTDGRLELLPEGLIEWEVSLIKPVQIPLS